MGIQHILYVKNHAKKLQIKVFLAGSCNFNPLLYLTKS
jgi:hypothetical protein